MSALMTGLMKSLQTTADVPSGTYVGCDIAPFSDALKKALSKLGQVTGNKVGVDKLHTTVIYSLQYVELPIAENLCSALAMPVEVDVIGCECFDALPDPKTGVRDGDVATIVLTLASPELQQLHAALKDIGCTHTYDEYKPHVSLYYGTPRADAHAATDKLREALTTHGGEPLKVKLTKFHVRPIVADWAAKNTKKR